MRARSLSGVVRRDGVTLAISTSGDAPALDGAAARGARRGAAARSRRVDRRGARGSARRGGATACRWTQRRPLLLEALNELYEGHATRGAAQSHGRVSRGRCGCARPCVARRRRARRSRAADAKGDRAAARAPTSCSTTRSIDERILRYARRAQRFFVGKRAGRHAMSQDGDPRADDSRRAPRPPRRAAEGRRPVRVRPRRRRSAGAAARPACRSTSCRA